MTVERHRLFHEHVDAAAHQVDGARRVMEWRGRDDGRVDVGRAQLRRVRDGDRDAVTFRQPFGAVHGAIDERGQPDAFMAREHREMKRLRNGATPDERDAASRRGDRSSGAIRRRIDRVRHKIHGRRMLARAIVRAGGNGRTRRDAVDAEDM